MGKVSNLMILSLSLSHDCSSTLQLKMAAWSKCFQLFVEAEFNERTVVVLHYQQKRVG